jgi:hypothetical protein
MGASEKSDERERERESAAYVGKQGRDLKECLNNLSWRLGLEFSTGWLINFCCSDKAQRGATLRTEDMI